MNIASLIDHTILKQDTLQADVQLLCGEAMDACFAAVCVPPYFVKFAKSLVHLTEVKVATVIDFPFGYSCIDAKVVVLKNAINDGADEVDMVISIAALKNNDWDYLRQEIEACIKPVIDAGKVIKIIVESGILSIQELESCCSFYSIYPISFMKTSTGYAAIGATVAAVKTMRRILPDTIGIKASGGIRTLAFATELINAGASRLGCSAGMKIIQEAKAAE